MNIARCLMSIYHLETKVLQTHRMVEKQTARQTVRRTDYPPLLVKSRVSVMVTSLMKSVNNYFNHSKNSCMSIVAKHDSYDEIHPQSL